MLTLFKEVERDQRRLLLQHVFKNCVLVEEEENIYRMRFIDFDSALFDFLIDIESLGSQGSHYLAPMVEILKDSTRTTSVESTNSVTSRFADLSIEVLSGSALDITDIMPVIATLTESLRRCVNVNSSCICGFFFI